MLLLNSEKLAAWLKKNLPVFDSKPLKIVFLNRIEYFKKQKIETG